MLPIGIALFRAFRYGSRGGNNLLVTFLVAWLTMISAAVPDWRPMRAHQAPLTD